MDTEAMDCVWIDPDLMDDLLEWIPDEIEKVNDWTYKICGLHFVVVGEKITVGGAVLLAMEFGWEPEADGDVEAE